MMTKMVGTRRQSHRISGAIAVLATGLWMALLLTSCAANTGGTGATAPAITVVDFRAQNIERVREGVLGLMGEDSAGLAGKGYIKAFEDDLAMRIPTQAAMLALIERDVMSSHNDYERISRRDRDILARNAQSQLQSDLLSEQQLFELKRYLDGRKTEAIGDLRTHGAAFAAGGGSASAKLGLAASYVAISCANEPGDVETITGSVEPLLEGLKNNVTTMWEEK